MQDELEAYLSQMETLDTYRVVNVVKTSEYETTQMVMLVLPDGSEQGPYIRKIIDISSGMGSAYKVLYEEQQSRGQNPYVPRIHECVQKGTELTVIMECIHGITLEALVQSQGPSIMLAAQVMPRICEGVQSLHESFETPLIHRDLKPSNIIISDTSITLIDFGIARMYQADASHDTACFGTRDYAPPEQFGYGQTSIRSDVYSLGIILAYCITGDPRAGRYPDVLTAMYGVPRQIQRIVENSVAFDPERRYGSVADFKNALAVLPSFAQWDSKKRSIQCIFQRVKMYLFPQHGRWTRPTPSKVERVMDAVPAPVWYLWNALVVAVYAFMVLVCMDSFLLSFTREYPIWCTFIYYFVYCLGCYTLIAIQMAYKRSLFKRLDSQGKAPFLPILSWAGNWIWIVGYITLGFIVVMVLLFTTAFTGFTKGFF